MSRRIFSLICTMQMRQQTKHLPLAESRRLLIPYLLMLKHNLQPIPRFSQSKALGMSLKACMVLNKPLHMEEAIKMVLASIPDFTTKLLIRPESRSRRELVSRKMGKFSLFFSHKHLMLFALPDTFVYFAFAARRMVF
ncbi:hypothetical protein BDW66DRAFT_139695, partial [Aspergillus desertorum]